MVTIPVDNILIADGEYVPAKAHSPGRPISIELSGEFGGATVTVGYASNDDIPVFIADTGTENAAKTAAGRWSSTSRPASGLPAVKVVSSTITTAIRVSIIDLLPR